MTTRAAVTTLIALALGPRVVPAQEPRALIQVGGGLALPMGSFGDVEAMGWQGSVSALRPLSDAWWLTLDAAYGRLPHQGGAEGHASVTGATIGVTWRRRSGTGPVRPFVSAGGGLMRVTVAVPGFGSAAATKFAVAAGAGVSLGPGGRWWIAARWVSVSTSPHASTLVPITVGVAVPLGGS